MLAKRIKHPRHDAGDAETFVSDAAPGPIFRPGRNAWRVARADRAAVLIDAAA